MPAARAMAWVSSVLRPQQRAVVPAGRVAVRVGRPVLWVRVPYGRW
jgi:hypothetical protein